MIIEPFTLHPHNKHYVGKYDEKAMHWRRLGAISKIDNMVSVLKGRTVGSVLEVGCGTGAVLAEAARRSVGSTHTGVDVADPNDHLDERASCCTFLKYDGIHLPFADQSFDLVYASHVIEHVMHPRLFMAELSRVAKFLIYVEVPCEIHLRSSHVALQTSLDIGHINAYSPESYMILLQSCALPILEFELFDLTRDLHCFDTPPIIGNIKMAMRRAALAISPSGASRLFTLHCGSLLEREPTQ